MQHADIPATLLTAAENGNWAFVKLLAEGGADLQAKDKYGRTVLHYAAGNGHLDTVKWLLEKGADLQAKNIYGGTVLHSAAIGGHLDTVKWLVEKGADVNAKTGGSTALSLTSNNEVKQWLREHGAT